MSTQGFLNTFEESSTDALLSIARICEQAERYEDMCQAMKALVEKKCAERVDLDTEERNLLSVAYKNVVGSKRASWRTLASGDEESPMVAKYRVFIENELDVQCREVLELLESQLLPLVEEMNNESETKVFYAKMCGDYYRYLAEFRTDDKANEEKSLQNYNTALETAKKILEPTHPTRLGLALNLSVCYYEIAKKPTEACELAKTAFDEAIAKLDGINDQTYKDSTLIMQLLRDNLTLWTTNEDQDE